MERKHRYSARERRGARHMIANGLSLARNDQLLLVASEGYEAEILLLSQEATRLGVQLCSIVISEREQRRIKTDVAVPAILRAAIDTANGMIVLQRYAADLTPFRMAVLNYFKNTKRRGRAASMPDVRLEHFPYAEVDARKIDRDAKGIADMLVRAKAVEVRTVGFAGEDCSLFADVTGQYPTIGGSRIDDGAWGNIPVGETFVLPRPYKSHGRVAINGSLPGWPMKNDGEGVVLTVEKGRIQRIEASNSTLQEYATNMFFSSYEKLKPASRNAHVLCEIGFGVNRSIKKCHGSPIFDEKIFGTVHVAFGTNRQLGGRVAGRTHHDLVTLEPTVVVTSDCDRHHLLKAGRLSFRRHLSWTELKPVGRRRLKVVRNSTCSVSPTGILFLEWYQSIGAIATTQIGDVKTSSLCATIYSSLQDGDTVGSLTDRLVSKLGVPSRVIGAGLTLLKSYGIVFFRSK